MQMGAALGSACLNYAYVLGTLTNTEVVNVHKHKLATSESNVPKIVVPQPYPGQMTVEKNGIYMVGESSSLAESALISARENFCDTQTYNTIEDLKELRKIKPLANTAQSLIEPISFSKTTIFIPQTQEPLIERRESCSSNIHNNAENDNPVWEELKPEIDIIPPPEEFRDAIKTCDSPEMETSISENGNDSCDSGFLSDAEDLTTDALRNAVPFALKTPRRPKNNIKVRTAPVLLTILEMVFSLYAFWGNMIDEKRVNSAFVTSHTSGNYAQMPPKYVGLSTKFEAEVNYLQNYHGCLGRVKFKKIPPNGSVAVYPRCGVSPVALTVPGWSSGSCVPRDGRVPRVRFKHLGTILQQNRNKANTNNSNPLFHFFPP